MAAFISLAGKTAVFDKGYGLLANKASIKKDSKSKQSSDKKQAY